MCSRSDSGGDEGQTDWYGNVRGIKNGKKSYAQAGPPGQTTSVRQSGSLVKA